MHWPYIFHKNISKQITDLNGKHKIIKILQGYVSEKFSWPWQWFLIQHQERLMKGKSINWISLK